MSISLLQSGQNEQALRDTAPPTVVNRRNLPRASHACQWCRVKKAKCNQQNPCSNCIRHGIDCEYGVRRKKEQRTHLQNQNRHIREQSRDSPRRLPTPTSSQSGQDEFRQSRGAETSGLVSQNPDVVGDVNEHTQGTEFYGTSSNFVLLNQLLKFAQQQLPVGNTGSGNYDRTSSTYTSQPVEDGQLAQRGGSNNDWLDRQHNLPPALSARQQGHMSIINLLSNEEVLSPPSRPKTPVHAADESLGARRTQGAILEPPARRREFIRSPRNGVMEGSGSQRLPILELNDKVRRDATFNIQGAQKRLEREYVRLFMNNLHYIHPMLDAVAFIERCEQEIWEMNTPSERKRGFRHFLALYNIVVAVGALIAGSNLNQVYQRDIRLCMEQFAQPKPPTTQLVTSQTLSRSYFQRSRKLLGDVFEVCSLESAQTLLLMSLYCQNSHKPHACYMYCGQAVRTALAIGLANESTSPSIEDLKAARRTWWCIYSHEIDMSCSSGRRDSLGKPRNYQIPMPVIRDQAPNASQVPDAENNSVAMINEMVTFAAILRRVSKELYHDSKGLTLQDKSSVAKELDKLLDEWKYKLPEYLNFEQLNFRGEEGIEKQKVVLHLRYLNARILIHRPFLAPSVDQGPSHISSHVDSCLDAARKTIEVMYEAYAHRHYFRTWWYNSTYTLYAGMIVLYTVMLGQIDASSGDLLKDVVKVKSILESMEEVPVARRSADLVREGLEVAQALLRERQHLSSLPQESGLSHGNEQVQVATDVSYMSNADYDISRTLFSSIGQGSEAGPLLASLIDPSLLQDFTAGTNNMNEIDFAAFALDGTYGNGQEWDFNSPM